MSDAVLSVSKILAAIRRGEPDVRVTLKGRTYAMHVCGLEECDTRQWRAVTSGTHGGQFRFYCCDEHRLVQQRRLTNARQKRWQKRKQALRDAVPEKAPDPYPLVTHLYRNT